MSDDRPIQTALLRGRCPALPELAARYLEEYLEKIRRAVDGLDDTQVWWRAAGGNSIANLEIHLAGNLGLWLGHGLAGRPSERDRASEFAADRTLDAVTALRRLEEAVEDAVSVLRAEEAARLEEPVEVQGYAVDRRGVIVHAMEHMSYHAGQIVLLAKQLRGPEHGLEFYPQHAGE